MDARKEVVLPLPLIEPVAGDIDDALWAAINGKTKPVGALGRLEALAFQLGRVQGGLQPEIRRPELMVFAGDHGVTVEGVSPYPAEVTAQMARNFLQGGAAVNVFARQNDLALRVIDAGVKLELGAHPALVDRKVARGTANLAVAPAMTADQRDRAVDAGLALAAEAAARGCNTLAFGDMGIGNTTAAAAVMAALCDLPPEQCAGRGTGLDDAGLARKIDVLKRALARCPRPLPPLEAVRQFAGLEQAMMFGAMMGAASRGMTLVIDGFIVTAVALAAWKQTPAILDYCVFAHRSGELGHGRMLDHIGVRPLLDLDMRLGEGTGAALAMPLLRAAAGFLREMASFESAGVSGRHA